MLVLIYLDIIVLFTHLCTSLRFTEIWLIWFVIRGDKNDFRVEFVPLNAEQITVPTPELKVAACSMV